MSDIILKFDQVSFRYGPNKPILNEVSFSIRQGMKVTLMGQNGADQSTIFDRISRVHQPELVKININATDYETSYPYFITYRYIVSLFFPSLRRDEALPLMCSIVV